MARVQGADLLAIGIGQGDIEARQVLRHALAVGGLGNDDDALVEQEAHCHLGRRGVVRRRDPSQDGIVQKARLSGGQRAPRLDLTAGVVQQWPQRALLEVRVELDLVHSGRNLRGPHDLAEFASEEVRQPDGPRLSAGVRLLQGAPGAHLVAHGPVDQEQVHILGVESPQRILEGLGGLGLSRAQGLGDQEDVVAGHAVGLGAAQGRADSGLIAIQGGGVDVPVADLERLARAALRDGGIDQIGAVAEHGGGDPFRQGDVLHEMLLRACCR